MAQYVETFLENHFDGFEFFLPGCKDKRMREVHMRTKYCMTCKGFEHCKTHPHYWLEGENQRRIENEKNALEELANPRPKPQIVVETEEAAEVAAE